MLLCGFDDFQVKDGTSAGIRRLIKANFLALYRIPGRSPSENGCNSAKGSMNNLQTCNHHRFQLL